MQGEDVEAAPSADRRLPRDRARGACMICHRRKIRCNLSTGVPTCSNCETFGYECVARERKRKRYCVVTETSPEARARTEKRTRPGEGALASISQDHTSPVAAYGEVPTPAETADFVHSALTSQFRPLSQPSAQFNFGPVAPSGSSLSSPEASIRPRTSSTARTQGFLGRSQYLSAELEKHEASPADQEADLPHSSLTEDDWKVLHLRKAFDLPPRAVRESLISSFVAKCQLWMPVVPPETLARLQHGDVAGVPLLLVQALFMAGSRMETQSSPLDIASSQDYYNRAKVLFFMGYESDPMTLATAVTILQYWNPSGPEHVSIHNSSYWLRVGVGLVHQIGLHREPKADANDRHLRRRIFWTLYARDSLLSAGQGRPRAIHLADCDIAPPSVSDFLHPDKAAYAFVAHVKISGLLGDLTQWCLRGSPNAIIERARFHSRLCDWAEELPNDLRILDPSQNYRRYDCDVRFLYLPYLMAIMILYKPRRASGTTSFSETTVASTIAASCVARIFEDALARGETRNGVAMSAIYLLIAGICALSNSEYPMLWQASMEELKVITLSLIELSKTWQTATGSLRILRRLQNEMSTLRSFTQPPPLKLQDTDKALFEPFGSSFCSKLEIVLNNESDNSRYQHLHRSPDRVEEGRPQASNVELSTESRTLEPAKTLDGAAELQLGDLYDADLSHIFELFPTDSLYSDGNWFLDSM